MALHSNSTFLPVLDDLLSPEFRPVLQTPTVSKNFIGLQQDAHFTNGHSSNGQNGQAGGGDPDHMAARKIQNWWKSHSKTGGDPDPMAERAKHSIRHRRTEEHVNNLENQVALLKNALQSERKLRSLQLEAIRSLWSQVQRISAPAGAGSESLMSQSMPNGLVVNNSPAKKNQMSSSCYAEVQGGQGQDVQPATQSSTCSSNCAKEIENLKQTLQVEMNGLREMIARLTKDKDPVVNPIGDNAKAPDGDKDTATTTSTAADPEPDIVDISTASSSSSASQPQRPASLNLKQTESETPKEVDGFANEMAAKVLFDAATLDDDC